MFIRSTKNPTTWGVKTEARSKLSMRDVKGIGVRAVNARADGAALVSAAALVLTTWKLRVT
jgi:hypothetical protein